MPDQDPPKNPYEELLNYDYENLDRTLGYAITGDVDGAIEAIKSGKSPLFYQPVDKENFSVDSSNYEIPSYVKEAMRKRNEGLIEAYRGAAEQSSDRAKQMARGALFALGGPALMQAVTGVDMDAGRAGSGVLDRAFSYRERADEARRKAEQLSSRLPGETDLSLAQKQAKLDREEATAEEKAAREYEAAKRQNAAQIGRASCRERVYTKV